MVSRACACGGRIERKNGQEVCDRCGPRPTYGHSSAAELDESRFKHLYKTARWRKEAEAWKRANPFCICCTARGIVTARRGRRGILVDHVIPAVLIGEAAFWDRGNYQTLCLDCDLRYKKPLERKYANDPKRLLEAWTTLLHELRVATLNRTRDSLLEGCVQDALSVEAPRSDLY